MSVTMRSMPRPAQPTPTDRKIRDGVLMAAGAVAVVVCCLGDTLLFALGIGAVTSIVFGPWGLVAVLVGSAIGAVWWHRRRRAMRAGRMS